MTLLSGILKRAPVALSLESLAVVRDTFSTEKLTRSNTMANLNLPTPIGKREQAKRFLGRHFQGVKRNRRPQSRHRCNRRHTGNTCLPH